MRILKAIGAILLWIIVIFIVALIGLIGWFLSTIAGFVVTGVLVILGIMILCSGNKPKKPNPP
jgi:uncharacterized membrane protein